MNTAISLVLVVALLAIFLITGYVPKLPGLGLIRRKSDPTSYWFGIGLLAFGLLVVIFGALLGASAMVKP